MSSCAPNTFTRSVKPHLQGTSTQPGLARRLKTSTERGRISFCPYAAARAKQKGRKGPKGNQKRSGGASGGEKRNANAIVDPLVRMREFEKDETLMFQPIPGDPNALQIVYAYPNTYSVGITSLGYQLVWAFFATSPAVSVSRWFTDASDALPANPALLGFSFSWELDYVNILSSLEGLGLPLRSSERSDGMPLVFGGGPVLTANPEPFAEFFDVILLGDGEEMLQEFVDAVRATTGASGSREDVLTALSQIPGIYVPSLYSVTYSAPDGEIVAITPQNAMVPAFVEKRTYKGGTLATSTVVSPIMAWEDIFMVEVVRSCPEMCRFCLASYLTLPFRAAPVEGSLIPSIEKALKARFPLLIPLSQARHFPPLARGVFRL
ncbi:hypothetical protein CYMTET_21483 [Cymbomonas tetramitiformis]|uniref:Radical SAM domain-containing protein n=1 Tax=Cymbomonas tetramitiformis TaxID=36881 RepID=A0AAE0G216_9CHLO|nr:hypothetical protein CYMTET_21483 [Cymbomonas tetramitiformis]